MFVRLKDTLETYMDYPMEYQDIEHTVLLIIEALRFFRENDQTFNETTAYDVLAILDILMSENQLRDWTETVFTWETDK